MDEPGGGRASAEVEAATDAFGEAIDAAKRWERGGEDALRAALRALAASGGASAQAYGWDRMGAYFLDRAKPLPAALSYARAADLALLASDREAEDRALFGLCYTLGDLHEGNAQLAVLAILDRRDARGALPTVEESIAALQLPELGRRRLLGSVATDAKCRRRVDRVLRKLRRSLPNFEARFLSGELRFDDPDQMFEFLREPHRDVLYREQGAKGVHRVYRRRLTKRLIVGALPLLLIGTLLAARVIDGTRWLVWIVLGPVLALYLVAWGVAIKAITGWVRASRLQTEAYRDIAGIERGASTHSQAYRILQEFAENRSPFALYLRSFGIEASESVTPDTSMGLGAQSKAEANQFALLRGSSATAAAAGFLGPTQWVVTRIGQEGRVEEFLAANVVRYLPMIAISNPAALAVRVEKGLPRIDVANDDWKMAVRLLVSTAKFIVMECPDLSPGVIEELEIILNRERQGDAVIVEGSATASTPPEEADELRKVFDRVVEARVLLAADLSHLPAFDGLLPQEHEP